MNIQCHLIGKGHSGRAVRLKALDPADVEANLLAAAKLAGADAGGLEIKTIEWRNGIKSFVTEFSEPCTNPVDPAVKWRKPKPDELDSLGSVFTAKDVGVLTAIFREYHEVMPSELDAIMGKAISLSSEG